MRFPETIFVGQETPILVAVAEPQAAIWQLLGGRRTFAAASATVHRSGRTLRDLAEILWRDRLAKPRDRSPYARPFCILFRDDERLSIGRSISLTGGGDLLSGISRYRAVSLLAFSVTGAVCRHARPSFLSFLSWSRSTSRSMPLQLDVGRLTANKRGAGPRPARPQRLSAERRPPADRLEGDRTLPHANGSRILGRRR